MDALKLIILGLHNILRWIILGLGILTLVKMYSGWIRNKPWTVSERKIGMLFTTSLDLQLLLGFLLYFVFSQLVRTAFTDFGTAMKDPVLRFFSVEHITIMIIAIALGHYGSSIAKKELEDNQKFKRSAIIYTISIALIILGIPWSLRQLLPGI